MAQIFLLCRAGDAASRPIAAFPFDLSPCHMGRDIDAIVERVKTLIPNVMVEQLRVKFPGVDDDGLWFFGLPGIDRDIQIESPTGNCPFWVEHDGMATSSEARTANTIDAAVEEVVEYLSCLQNPRQT